MRVHVINDFKMIRKGFFKVGSRLKGGRRRGLCRGFVCFLQTSIGAEKHSSSLFGLS